VQRYESESRELQYCDVMLTNVARDQHDWMAPLVAVASSLGTKVLRCDTETA